MMPTTRKLGRNGLTLLELIVVLTVLVALAGLVVANVGDSTEDAREDTTRSSLKELQSVIANRYWPDMDDVLVDSGVPVPGYPHPDPTALDPSTRQSHPQLKFLFDQPSANAAYSALTKRGWNGPYLQHPLGHYAVDATRGFTTSFGETGDPAALDGWGNPIVIQRPTVGTVDEQTQYTRLVSAGPDGAIDTPATSLMPTAAQRDDDRVMFLRVSDEVSWPED